MPLYRRIPKFGFKNPFRVEYSVLNLDRLTEVLEKYPHLAKAAITPEVLFDAGIISNRRKPVKLLGRGELGTKVEIHVHKASASAVAAIEKAGGKLELLQQAAPVTETAEATPADEPKTDEPEA